MMIGKHEWATKEWSNMYEDRRVHNDCGYYPVFVTYYGVLVCATHKKLPEDLHKFILSFLLY
jgi:hypothetical protein